MGIWAIFLTEAKHCTLRSKRSDSTCGISFKKNKHTSLKNKVFYRQDYLDEFEQIWETQARFHEILSPTLKEEIRDTVIFYQRKLKSQKGLLGYCEFESWQMVQKDKQGNVILNKLSGLPKMSTVGHKVIPKSSPLFQEFKIWQNLNNLELISRTIENERYVLNQDQKELLFEELNFKGPISEKEVLKLIGYSEKEWKTNQPYLDRTKGTVKPIEGNVTNQVFLKAYKEILDIEGYGHDWKKKMLIR